jgi:hypothetical protein
MCNCYLENRSALFDKILWYYPAKIQLASHVYFLHCLLNENNQYYVIALSGNSKSTYRGLIPIISISS